MRTPPRRYAHEAASVDAKVPFSPASAVSPLFYKAGLATFLCMMFASGGCGPLKRLGGIENSTKKTEKTAGELNENTKDVKTSIEEVEASTKSMKKELESTRKELEAANARLAKTNDELAGMKDAMSATQGNTDDLVGNTGNTYVDLRQGDTLAARMRQLDSLAEVDALESKISEAWKYFSAFEYQFWKGSGVDTPERRELLYYEGLHEFLHDVERFMPHEGARSGTPLSENAGMKNLYALATALEATNSVQTLLPAEAAPPPGRPVGGATVAKSMLDLLHEALKSGADVEAGKRTSASLQPWERIVLEKEDAVLYLLHVRTNFLPAIPLSRLTDVERSGFARFLELLRLGFLRWQARLDAVNNYQLEAMAVWLDKSLAESSFLGELRNGSTVATTRRRDAAAGRGERLGAYDRALRQAFAHMSVVDSVTDSARREESDANPFLSERVMLVDRFRVLASAIARN